MEIYGLTSKEIQQIKYQPTIGNITLKQLCALYLSDYFERQKITAYVALRSVINNHILKSINPNIKVTNITYSVIDEFRQKLASSELLNKNNVISYLKMIFRFANDYYGYRCLPVYRLNKFRSKISDSKKESYYIYTYKDFKKYIKGVVDPFNLSLFYCLYYFGLRIGEIRGLQWEDIDKGILYIRRAATAAAGTTTIMIDVKSSSSYRYFKIPKFIQKEFELLRTVSNSKKFIFGNPKKEANYPVSESTIRRHINYQAELKGMPYLHPHAWRHSCASFLVNKLNCDIYQVKEWLGHSDIVITSKIYVQLFPEEKDKITEKMNNLNKY